MERLPHRSDLTIWRDYIKMMTSKMLIEKNRLIELLYYEDKRVRDTGVETLQRFFSGSKGVIEYLLQSIETYENQCLSLAAGVRSFIPGDTDIGRIIKLINDCKFKTDEYSLNLQFHLQISLMHFPIDILERNKQLFRFNEDLTRFFEVIKNHERIRSQEPDVLLNELEKLCDEHQGKRIEKEIYKYGRLLFNGLKRHSKAIKHKVIMFLSHETKEKYHFEEYMVELAGELKLEETIPYLFRIYKDSDFMHTVNSKCIHALGKIGTREVVSGVDNLYNNSDDEKRSGLAEIFKYIPYDYSEEVAIRLLKEEVDLSNKTFLAGALCDLFSLRATDLIIEIINKKEYDPSIMVLSDYLRPIYVYHQKKFEGFQDIEQRDKNHFQETMESSPFYTLGKKLREILDFSVAEKEKLDSTKSNTNAHKKNVIPYKGVQPKSRIRKKKKKKK